MEEDNYESSETMVEETFMMENGISAESMLKEDEVHKQFTGYYYDGKATAETAKQIENIMLGKA